MYSLKEIPLHSVKNNLEGTRLEFKREIGWLVKQRADCLQISHWKEDCVRGVRALQFF